MKYHIYKIFGGSKNGLNNAELILWPGSKSEGFDNHADAEKVALKLDGYDSLIVIGFDKMINAPYKLTVQAEA